MRKALEPILVGLWIAWMGVPLAAWSTGSGVAVVGNHRTEFLLPEGLEVAAYTNNGYALALEGRRARVEVRVRPLTSTVSFRPPAPMFHGAATAEATEVTHLARAVTADAETRYQAVSRILGWVSRNVRYRLDRSLAQNPRAVLDRRTAYCTGFARLSVALLGAVEIQAREVAGLVVQEAGDVRFHRWIEVFYPDRGWVFSDPLRSHHYVPANYLPLASEVLRHPYPEEMRVSLLSHRENLWVVDAFPGVADGVRGRKNDDRQSVGVLRIEAPSVEHHPATIAVLEGGGRRRSLPLHQGAGTFLDVEPGRYTLRLEGDGVTPRTLRVRLQNRGRNLVQLQAKEERGR